MIFAITPIVNPVISGIAGKSPEDAPSLFARLLAGIVGFFLTVATIWTFFQLLLGGLNWISSGGDKGKLEAAQQRIQQAIVGLLIVFASWGIFLLLLQFFGMSPIGSSQIQLKIPTIF